MLLNGSEWDKCPHWWNSNVNYIESAINREDVGILDLLLERGFETRIACDGHENASSDVLCMYTKNPIIKRSVLIHMSRNGHKMAKTCDFLNLRSSIIDCSSVKGAMDFNSIIADGYRADYDLFIRLLRSHDRVKEFRGYCLDAITGNTDHVKSPSQYFPVDISKIGMSYLTMDHHDRRILNPLKESQSLFMDNTVPATYVDIFAEVIDIMRS